MSDIMAIKNAQSLAEELFIASNYILINIENPAILLTTDKYIVTNVGAPWYTSGTQEKNGKEAILKETPATSNITEKINKRFVDPEEKYRDSIWPVVIEAISLKKVEPVIPYR